MAANDPHELAEAHGSRFYRGRAEEALHGREHQSEAGERTYAIEAKGLKVTRLTMPGSPFSVNHRTLLSRRTPNWAPWPERGTPSKINPGDDL